MTQPGRTRAIVLLLAVVLSSLTLSAVWTFLLGLRSQRVVLESCSPAFCLRVAEGITSYGFSTKLYYEVWITRRQSPDHGYVVDHSFGAHGSSTESAIRASSVEWSDSGVTLREPSGQTLFVPKRLYEGGR